MAAKPTVGGSDGTWGTELNEYLAVEHDADGTHGAITPTSIAATGDILTTTWLKFGSAASATISSGAVTATGSLMQIIGEGAAADNLDTINGGNPGKILILQAQADTVTITVRDNSVGGGNIRLASAASFAMDSYYDKIVLIYSNSQWVELCRSNNGA